tara:strand:- start:10762 stop:11805 length:1044 start_codon:yes stop_codon:yes gene_type:complete
VKSTFLSVFNESQNGHRGEILILSSRGDEQWANLLRTALSTRLPTGCGVARIDEGEYRKVNGREKIKAAIDAAAVIMVLTSENMLASPLVSRLHLPRLLKEASHRGACVRQVLARHCFYEHSEFKEFEPLHNLQRPLDSLNLSQGEDVFKIATDEIQALLAPGNDEEGDLAPRDGEASSDADNERSEKSKSKDHKEPPEKDNPERKVELAASSATASIFAPQQLDPWTEEDSARQALRLEQVFKLRQKNLVLFRECIQKLLLVAAGLLVLGALLGLIRWSQPLFFSLAGAALFTASIALVLRQHVRAIVAGIVTLKYVKTGLMDDSLPSRERAILMKKAQLMRGGTF